MRMWFNRKSGGLVAFLLVGILVAGALGWATQAALRLEREQQSQQAQAEHAERLRLALWRMDSRLSTILAREDSRPFSHYSAVFAPPVALDGIGTPWPPGSVVEPSPLLHTELPEWMLLHFQTDSQGWESPQVLSENLSKWLTRQRSRLELTNVTSNRQHLLAKLSRELPPRELLNHARRHARQTVTSDRAVVARQHAEWSAANPARGQEAAAQNEFFYRNGIQSQFSNLNWMNEQRVAKNVAMLNSCRNGEEWLLSPEVMQTWGNNFSTLKLPEVPGKPMLIVPRDPPSAEVTVTMSPLVGVWVPTTSGTNYLVALRMVRVEGKEICQGIVLDGQQLAKLLVEEVKDLFPDASVEPVRGRPAMEELALTMTALPLRLDPGPVPAVADPGWTTLRLGLIVAWAAALIALVAVGLGGWSLLDLSERRIRFVSAVTHELRTPLTTLRLYLDMLTGGMVQSDEQRNEYLQTLNAEADRLTRLVSNVLDFSRLENQRPTLSQALVSMDELVAQTSSTWQGRCGASGKELIVETQVTEQATLHTDVGLVGQVLGNLIDNACKYSHEAEERRVWLRARCEGGHAIFEVEDRGPGVLRAERQVIFRPFRRGRRSDATTGGVGLGLALALRWTHLLGGRLTLHDPPEGGACFRVELPLASGK